MLEQSNPTVTLCCLITALGPRCRRIVMHIRTLGQLLDLEAKACPAPGRRHIQRVGLAEAFREGGG